MPRLLPLLAVLLAVLAGCAAHRSGDALRAVRFEGNDPPKGVEGWFAPQTDRALRNAISQPPPSRLALLVPGMVEPAWLDPDALPSDALRVEVWYANHGYFDARFLGWELVRRRVTTRADGTPRRRMTPTMLVGHVDQGEPSRLVEPAVTGLERLPGGADGPLAKRVAAQLRLEAGEIFDRDTWREAVDGARAMLRERGYAHAAVESRVEVDADARTVAVITEVEPGPVCTFGDVRVEGLERLPEARVRLDIPIRPGERYSPKALAQTRARLFGLGTFAVVDVSTDPAATADPTARVLPVVVRLKEGKFREITAGPALTYEPGQQTLQATGAFRDNNVAAQLWQLEQTAAIGPGASVASVAELGDPAWLEEIVPVADLEGKLNIPHALLPNLSFAQDGRVRLTLQSGFRFFRPSWSPSVTYNHLLLEHLSAQLAYRLQYTLFLQTGEGGTTCDAETGETLTDNYLLSGLEETLSYDDRNDPISPYRGWMWTLGLAQYGGALGGNQDLLRATGEVRRFWSVPHILDFDPEQFVIAARVGGGLLVPYGDTTVEAIPTTERLTLGGGTTVRGWGAERLGPLGAPINCDDAGDTVVVDLVPIGGDLSAYGNLEARLGYFYDVGVVGFVDAGRVWATAADFALDGVQVSVGAGLRYRTAIGPVRFDVASRLGNAAEFAEEPRWAVHLGLSEAF